MKPTPTLTPRPFARLQRPLDRNAVIDDGFHANSAPAHRYLIARKIARNLETLREQDCFTADCRTTFSNLSQRWTAKADQMAQQEDKPRGGMGGFLQPIWKAH